ncbi:MAG: YeiH family protein [Methyloceanibacter sp.]
MAHKRSAQAAAATDKDTVAARPGGLNELWTKEDWWAVWLGLSIVIVAIIFYLASSTIKPIAVKPPSWDSFATLRDHFAAQWGWYVAQFILWAVLFGISTWAIGFKPSEFLSSFFFVYLLSLIIFVIGQWKQAGIYSLEPPLVGLVVGLLIANFVTLPSWFDAGFRVEYYIKTGIVLLGATLPFTLIIWAGPLAFVQATIVSVVTFAVIFYASLALGLDRRLAACLGAGGAICGVSGAIAMAGAVKATKEQASVAIAIVVFWAIVMIFVLPFASKALGLPAVVAGAWIGNSEFADATGLAAAQAYGGIAEASNGAIQGTTEHALGSFTLMKVIGRDIWIGIWAFVFALIATTRWEVEETGTRPSPREIWWRFPKFVVGFLIASALVTLVVAGYSFADYKKLVEPNLVAPIKDLRAWAFTFCFLSIGLTTRFRDFAKVGAKPFLGFTAGVVVNVILGFLLSAVVFASFWTSLVAAPAQ